MRRLFTIAALISGLTTTAADACGNGSVSIADSRFSVIVADDPAERARGLMRVRKMPRDAGMLFVFPKQQSVSFWMKDTLMPLDMIFIDDEGEVVKVHEAATPGSRDSIQSGRPVRYVLEVNAGVARAAGIEPGAHFEMPMLARCGR